MYLSICMCVYICICVCVYICVCILTCTYERKHIKSLTWSLLKSKIVIEIEVFGCPPTLCHYLKFHNYPLLFNCLSSLQKAISLGQRFRISHYTFSTLKNDVNEIAQLIVIRYREEEIDQRTSFSDTWRK